MSYFSSPILVTGVAGFIGFHVARRLLDKGMAVYGIDNLSPYYDPGLKEARLAELDGRNGFSFRQFDLADSEATSAAFAEAKPSRVIHLAAQPGVRQSLVEPRPYVMSNVVAFLNVLEECRHGGIEHLVYASSSSVYGANRKVPFSERDNVDHPVSLYAATKKADELMAHSYAHLYGLPSTGLRFFTVYGPWGRPDMAVYVFTDSIARGCPITVAKGGAVWRDFTYIDDVVDGVLQVLEHVPSPNPDWDGMHPDPATSSAPHRIYNIGNNKPEELNRLISLIEEGLGEKAKRTDMPLPPGDVPETAADISDITRDTGFVPVTSLDVGVSRFIDWYRDFHRV